MPVPWEALIPFGLTMVMFTVAGTGLQIVKRFTNDGKPTRYGLDKWDDQMMERDFRLTGSKRGQSMNAFAPTEYSTNSRWEKS